MGEALTNGTGDIQILGKNSNQVKSERVTIVDGFHLKLGYSWIFSGHPALSSAAVAKSPNLCYKKIERLGFSEPTNLVKKAE